MAYDKRSFLSGLAMGLCGKGDPTFTGSGKMLYNGVALPDINTVWDKTAYRYAVVRVSSRYDAQWVSFCSVPFYIHPTNPNEYVTNSAVGNSCYYALSNGSWVLGGVNVDMPANWLALDRDDVIWTSHDIIKPTDNSLFLAASEPVPVYA